MKSEKHGKRFLYYTPEIKEKPILFQGNCAKCGDEVWSKKDNAKYCRKCIEYGGTRHKEDEFETPLSA